MATETGLARNLTDKFYTNDNIAKKCVELFIIYIKPDKTDLIIEPSAGNGSFIPYIKSITSNYKFYDIWPEHNDIIQQDFLEIDIKSNDSIHIIGNPPFGRQSSLAIKFIKKSCEYCQSISFILPKSFKKDSMKSRIPLKFHLIHEMDIPNDSFTINGNKHNVPCVFQIWLKQDKDRKLPPQLTPIGYDFVKNDETPDISFRRVGVNAGVIDKSITNKSIQSHYFIKFDKKITNKLFNELSKIVFNCSNDTVGAKSISKQEIIKEFNPILSQNNQK